MAEQQKSFADYVKDLMNILPTVNNNPMLSVTSQTDVDKYRENPFYMQDAIRKRNAEEEAAKKGKVAGGGGLFGSMPSTGGDSANQENQRNYYVEREAQLRAANLPEDEVQAIIRAEQEANNTKFAAGLNLFANAFLPGVGMLNASKYGAALPDYLQGNMRTMIGDTSGHRSPYTPKPAGIAAPVVSGQTNYNTYSPDTFSNNIMDVGTPYEEVTPTFDWSSSGDSSGGGGGYSDGYSSSGGGGYTSSADGSYGGYI